MFDFFKRRRTEVVGERKGEAFFESFNKKLKASDIAISESLSSNLIAAFEQRLNEHEDKKGEDALVNLHAEYQIFLENLKDNIQLFFNRFLEYVQEDMKVFEEIGMLEQAENLIWNQVIEHTGSLEKVAEELVLEKIENVEK